MWGVGRVVGIFKARPKKPLTGKEDSIGDVRGRDRSKSTGLERRSSVVKVRVGVEVDVDAVMIVLEYIV